MDLFSLVARLTLDRSDYESGVEDARGSFSGLAQGIGNGLKTAAKVGTAALGAAAAGAVAITKQAIDQYADYEQLVGGVDTLFKGASQQVQAYAADAYKTAGMSANEYMETVTSFSASLIQSLGGDTAKAAEMADMAITDMSDNANKMGTDMASIENAYNGFAKQQYQLLDNLKLGYGGTKQEMERLLADAEKLSGQKYDISSYADIVQAIHVVQTEMGITGTTAKEAAGTISGSINMLKGAWSNLVTGLGDENADFGKLVGDVVDSAVAAADNLLPRVEQILTGIASAVEKLAPAIAERLPGLISKLLPPLMTAAQSLLAGLTQAVIDNAPMLLKTGLELVLMLATGIADALPELIPSIVDVVLQIVEILTEPDTLGQLIEAALKIIVALGEGLIAALPVLIERVPVIIANIVTAIINALPKILEAGVQLVVTLGKGIIDGISQAVQAVGQLFDSIYQAFRTPIDNALNWGRDLITNFTNGIKDFINRPIEAVKGLAGKIANFLGFSEPEEGPLSNFHTYAPDMMALFAQGIHDNADLITDAISGAFNLAPQITAQTQPQTPAPAQQIVTPRAQPQRPIQIIFELDGAQRWIYNAVQAESQRVGVKLSGVTA